ncbi:hypothetical protein Ga0074812_11915 [Parafrankia irregularis]|uniref:Uncharacterized protein n=1 Tax=Parafrankia irregularis TaxID=795642 RepID=A0A0S4QTC2_9ACTN|nr:MULTISPECIES: hypothetical protein [Parafrankia]MBE3204534.1 hypothetical protein [Parafrankia sp. CH37]CUU58383.1 hypothetical protein Ga0074812_11915 [Parafrankia irregularis]
MSVLTSSDLHPGLSVGAAVIGVALTVFSARRRRLRAAFLLALLTLLLAGAAGVGALVAGESTATSHDGNHDGNLVLPGVPQETARPGPTDAGDHGISLIPTVAGAVLVLLGIAVHAPWPRRSDRRRGPRSDDGEPDDRRLFRRRFRNRYRGDSELRSRPDPTAVRWTHTPLPTPRQHLDGADQGGGIRLSDLFDPDLPGTENPDPWPAGGVIAAQSEPVEPSEVSDGYPVEDWYPVDEVLENDFWCLPRRDAERPHPAAGRWEHAERAGSGEPAGPGEPVDNQNDAAAWDDMADDWEEETPVFPAPPRSAWRTREDPFLENLSARIERVVRLYMSAVTPRAGQPARVDPYAPDARHFVCALTMTFDLFGGQAPAAHLDSLVAAVREVERRWDVVGTRAGLSTSGSLLSRRAAGPGMPEQDDERARPAVAKHRIRIPPRPPVPPSSGGEPDDSRRGPVRRRPGEHPPGGQQPPR